MYTQIRDPKSLPYELSHIQLLNTIYVIHIFYFIFYFTEGVSCLSTMPRNRQNSNQTANLVRCPDHPLYISALSLTYLALNSLGLNSQFEKYYFGLNKLLNFSTYFLNFPSWLLDIQRYDSSIVLEISCIQEMILISLLLPSSFLFFSHSLLKFKTTQLRRTHQEQQQQQKAIIFLYFSFFLFLKKLRH